MSNRSIIDWPTWTESPPGQYVLAWEQSQLDCLVCNLFGYHALQLGLPQLDALRENRMPCRGLMLDAASGASAPYRLPGSTTPGTAGIGPHHAPPQRETVWGDFLDLPFASQSVDLLILPHTLEFTHDPHLLLRESERVLMPGGRLVIVGFNSLSLWGMRQSVSRRRGHAFVPAAHDLIAFTRMKDWIKLLGFELERGRFGCYRPPANTEKWLACYAFMEATGDRWWPIFGATYMITAIKRVRGMRLIGPVKVKKKARASALNPVTTPNAH
jgi:SAM-dependent methyltransferase